jgi:hypothetical protein
MKEITENIGVAFAALSILGVSTVDELHKRCEKLLNYV